MFPRGPLVVAVSVVSAFAAPASGTQGVDTSYNVIFYVLDTVRADHFSLYGYERETTPFVDQLATEGMTWSGAHSSGTWTWPSVVSILTGVTVETHKVVDDALAMPSGYPNLAEILGTEGYSTHIFSSNPMLEPEGRARRHFQFSYVSARPDQELTDQIEGVIRDAGARPFFIHAQPIAAHSPYSCPSPFDSLFVDDEFYGGLGEVPQLTEDLDCRIGMRVHQVIDGILSMDWYVAQYDGLIAYMDDQIRQLFEMLEEEGLRENTLVVITSDHGEELAGDHGYYFCHVDHYEANTHVPLVLILPEAWQREHGQVRNVMIEDGNPDLIDLLPTTLEVLGLPIPGSVQGLSLIQTPEPWGSIDVGRAFRAIWDGRIKLIHRAPELVPSAGNELYNLADDPEERNDLADSLAGEAQRLEDTLLRIGLELDAIRYPQPTGTLFLSDIEDQAQVEGYFAFSKYSGSWTVVSENDTNKALGARIEMQAAPTSYLDFVALIVEPLWDYDLACRFALSEGTLSVQTRWIRWLDRGYRLHLNADGAQLLHCPVDGPSEELARAEIDISPDRWHELEFNSRGASITIIVDGQRIIHVPEANSEIWGSTYFAIPTDTGGEALVDDIRISRPRRAVHADLETALIGDASSQGRDNYRVGR